MRNSLYLVSYCDENCENNNEPTDFYSDYQFIYNNNDDNDNEIDYNGNNSYYYDIYRLEQEFMDSEKYNGQYVIGIISKGYNHDGDMLACSVSAKTFLSFPYINVLKFLFYYSIINISYPVIDIIKIHIDKDETYISIRKTFWISLIQRHWKKIMAEKKEIQRKKRTIHSQFYFAIHGKYPKSLNVYPTIHGMMSSYASKNDLFIESQ